MLTNDILDTLQDKYNLPKADLERIVDSQFKLLYESIQSRTVKSVKLINIGKVSPTSFLIKNYEKLAK